MIDLNMWLEKRCSCGAAGLKTSLQYPKNSTLQGEYMCFVFQVFNRDISTSPW